MKFIFPLVCLSILFTFSVQAESLSSQQIGISLKNSYFGNDFRKGHNFSVKDIDEQYESLGIHWGFTTPMNHNQSTMTYVFFDYGNTEVSYNDLDLNFEASLSRQLSIFGVGQNFQYNLNSVLYVKLATEIGIYNDKLTGSQQAQDSPYLKQSKRNTGAMFGASIATGAMLNKNWDLAIGYKYQYLPGNKFENINFTQASQLFFGVNYSF